VDVTVRVRPEGDEEAALGSDPEVAPGSEPTLRELRWVEPDELEELELLPATLKERLLGDADARWPASTSYLGGS
jgi:8-oxo-dGTP diphosphatase